MFVYIGGCYAGGTVGYFVNGVPAWSWTDANTYKREGVWYQTALGFELYDLDICLGHAAQGVYHHHSYSPCLAHILNDTGDAHSPIYGFAYDGYPIYGPYQSKDSLAISCWQPRDYQASSPTGCADGKRSCLLNNEFDYHNGTHNVSLHGPELNATILSGGSKNAIFAESGVYYQDYFYNKTCSSLGSQYLDEFNGHDHDGLGFHYHVTVNESMFPVFPFITGPKFFGCLPGGSGCLKTAGSFEQASKQSVCGVSTSSPSHQCSSNFSLVMSSHPTRHPTMAPTAASSKSPTRLPTMKPTSMPRQLNMNSKLTLSNCSSSTLNSNSENALINATAEAMDVSMDQVKINGYSILTSRRMLSSGSYNLFIDLSITFDMNQYDISDADTLFTTLSQGFEEVVNAGTFSLLLSNAASQYGATQLTSTSAVEVTPTDYSVTTSDDSNDSNNSLTSIGAIIGFIIAGVVLLAIIIGSFYYMRTKSSNFTYVYPSVPAIVVVEAKPVYPEAN